MANAASQPAPQPAPSRLLVAVSSLEAAARLVAPVADLARRLAAEVLIVHVKKPAADKQPGLVPDRSDAAAELGDRIGRGGDVTVRTLLMFSDDVARAILDTAAEQKVTMILLGLTGKGVLQRFFDGNVPMALLRETTLPVLLLPPDFGGTL